MFRARVFLENHHRPRKKGAGCEVELATLLYTAGQTDFLSLLEAQRALYTAEDALVQSNHTTATDLIALYKALGGGWESDAS